MLLNQIIYNLHLMHKAGALDLRPFTVPTGTPGVRLNDKDGSLSPYFFIFLT